MIGLLQRVTEAHVSVDGNKIGEIQKGLLILVGIEKTDTQKHADTLLQKLLHYRIFADENDKMNLSVKDINGGILIVSQFTLVADTQKGLRPSFSSGATPEHGEELYNYLITKAQQQHDDVQTGQFGADMKVTLCNDGPATFYLSI